MRTRPTAVFMAFGTKGDVHPICAIAVAFACDQEQYHVVFITHSEHKSLKPHLEAKGVIFLPVSSPPVLSPPEYNGSPEATFSLKKEEITREHRKECLSIVERIFEDDLTCEGDVIVINLFALEGWNLAELFHVRCVVAAPYVIPYRYVEFLPCASLIIAQVTRNMLRSAPASFQRKFQKEHPLLYKYLNEAPIDKVGWKDVIHWMWPLFTEEWGSWRNLDLKLSACPFMDPVTGLPAWHDRPLSPLLLYGFSKEVVECPGYWPSRVRVCGFWFLPTEWQFCCNKCAEVSALISSTNLSTGDELCPAHSLLYSFLFGTMSELPIFVGLSSIGSMGFMKNPQAFLQVIRNVLDISSHQFILLSAGYEPLDAAIHLLDQQASSSSEQRSRKDGVTLFGGRLFCFFGNIPYNWLFPRCAAAIHHGGSGSTAAALHSGIPQVICPFLLDQFYWAERMFWIGVAPEPLKRNQLLPDTNDDASIKKAANLLAEAINCALSPGVRERALDIAKRISIENGVAEAVRILKEEVVVDSGSVNPSA